MSDCCISDELSVLAVGDHTVHCGVVHLPLKFKSLC